MSTINKVRLPDVSDDEQALVDGLVDELNARSPRNLMRAAYYDGKRAIQQVSSIIPPQYYRLGIVLGWSAKAVDILARRCNLDRFVWPDGDLDVLGLTEIAKANRLYSEINSGVVSSLIHGPAFLITTRGETGEPKALLHVKDATSATGEWNARRRQMDNLLSITSWDDEGQPDGLALYLDGETVVAERDGSGWEAARSSHPWGVPVDPLVYKPEVRRPFGSSRISRPVMALHDAALREMIRLEGHMDIWSYPEFWLLGADGSIFKDENGNLKPSWQVMLGRIKGVPDADPEDLPEGGNPRADVKQFPASNPAPHETMLKRLAQQFSGETSIPLTSLGVSDMSNPTSADSYVASREDLIAEAEGATDDWTEPVCRAATRLLAIANDENGIPEKWQTIDAKWRSPMYLSRAAQADAGMKQLTAVKWLADTEVGLELLGLSEQQITRAMSEKRRADGRANVAALVNRQLASPTSGQQLPPVTPTSPTEEELNAGGG